MPASLFPDMDRSNSGLEDQRALQLAFELSMLGLSDSPSTNEPEQINSAFADENRGKKSQNMTECVPVPSSEHVAEIVGRQGELINQNIFFSFKKVFGKSMRVIMAAATMCSQVCCLPSCDESVKSRAVRLGVVHV